METSNAPPSVSRRMAVFVPLSHARARFFMKRFEGGSQDMQVKPSFRSASSAARTGPSVVNTGCAPARHEPPDLMTPAKASNPFMNDTGPEAVPPPFSISPDPRRADRLLPVPEPCLKSMPSVFARSRMDSIESSTEMMKQALHWGLSRYPQLNHTGLLNDAF